MARTSSTTSTRKKAGGGRQTKAQQQAKRQIAAIGLFAAGLFLGAVSLIQGESAWRVLHDTLYGLFGFAGVLIAPLLLYIAIMTTLDKPIGSLGAKCIQTAVIIVLVSSAVQVFSFGPLSEDGFWSATVELFQAGVLLDGGGIASALVGLPLMKLLGQTGAKIAVVILLFVSIMIFTGGTLIGLIRGAAKPVKKISESYERAVTERAEQKAAKPQERLPGAAPDTRPPRPGQGRFNVDIPLETDNTALTIETEPEPEEPVNTPEDLMPNHPVQRESAVPQGSFARQSLERLVFEDTKRNTLLSSVQPAERFSFDMPLAQDSVRTSSLPENPDLKEIVLGEELYTPESGYPDGAPNPPEGVYFRNPASDRVQTQADLIDGVIKLSEEGEEFWSEEPSKAKTFEFSGGGESGLGADEQPVDELGEVEQELFNTGSLGSLGDKNRQEPKLAAALAAAAAEQPAVTQAQARAANERFAEEIGKPEEYVFPPVSLLNEQKAKRADESKDELMQNGQRLVDTLKSFGVQTRIIEIAKGPAVTRYELQPSAGVKISKITSLADDIALNLAAAGVRIEAPIPNKPAVGIEVPNKNISMVSIREIIDSPEFVDAKSPVTMALGKDISGRITVADIGKMPHMLIAGATGSGKSVCINSIIISLLFKASPDEVKLLMVDPKVVELGVYNGIPHLLVPVVTDPKKAAGALAWAVGEMLGRYKLFADNSVRDIGGFNRLCKTNSELKPMPQIVIIIDELADLMMAAPNDVEDYICRLAQMARAAGMHLVIATQRPSVDVITGVIKANIPSRIAFAVSSSVDSRTILDSGGAEKLLGRGDMLFYPVGTSKPTRVQGCFVTDQEVERVVNFIKRQSEAAEYDEEVMEEIERQAVSDSKKPGAAGDGGGFSDDDEMLPAAIECVIEMGMASTSMLQRRLKLGYARAARLIDEMELKGIVGPFEGSKPRQVLISKERWQEMQLNQG